MRDRGNRRGPQSRTVQRICASRDCLHAAPAGQAAGVVELGLLPDSAAGRLSRAAHVVSDGCVAVTVEHACMHCSAGMDGSLGAIGPLSLTLPEVPLDDEFVLLRVVSADDQVVFTADEPVEALVPGRLAQHLRAAGRVVCVCGGGEGDDTEICAEGDTQVQQSVGGRVEGGEGGGGTIVGGKGFK